MLPCAKRLKDRQTKVPGDLVVFSDQKSIGMIIAVERANSAAYMASEHMQSVGNLRELVYYVLMSDRIVGPAYNWELKHIDEGKSESITKRY